MRPLLLGEAPSERGDRYHAFPLSGAPAARICKIMGWRHEGAAYWELIEHFWTMNTIARYDDAYPWSAPRARERWEALVAEEPGANLVVVALGRKAADAVGIPSSQQLGEWVGMPLEGGGYLEAVAAPHTSGRNRYWNEPHAEEFFRMILRGALTRANPKGTEIVGR